MFNPRPRMKGNLVSACAVTYNFLVSIHALTWRATFSSQNNGLLRVELPSKKKAPTFTGQGLRYKHTMI